MVSKSPPLVKRIYVIDTSYPLDLYRVPANSRTKTVDEKAYLEIEKRFRQALQNGHQLFVPLPCIFEVGNHIADVNDGGLRENLAMKMLDTIKRCVNESNPWTITPTTGISFLSDLFEEFARTEKYVHQQIGLVDAFTIHLAHRLKKDRGPCEVHIWTRN